MSVTSTPHTRAVRLGWFALAAGSGALLACSVARGPVPFLAFCFPALLMPALASAKNLKHAVLLGWASGTACNAVAFHWIAELLQTFGHFPAIAAWATAALLWLAQGLSFALAVFLSESLVRRGAPRWLLLPAALVVTSSWLPALFPWRPGSSFVAWSEFAQLAELGGTALIDACLMFGSAAFFESGVRASKAEPTLARTPALVAAACLLVPLVYGTIRLAQFDEERLNLPEITIGVVQPNIGILEKADRRLARAHLANLRELTERVSDADVVVWPETALPFRLARDAARLPGGAERYSPRRRDGHVPLLFGAVTRSGRCDRWNSALVMDRDGQLSARSDKVELLAFGETIPFWETLPFLQEMFPCPGMRAGDAPAVLPVGGASIGVLNCYEDVLAAHARTLALLEPELMVNLTNDAWFGDTQEPHLHQLVARWRTIETRRALVRVVNTGVSSHIDAAGRSLVETPTFERTAFVARVARRAGTTLYTRIGDITTPTMALWLLVVAWTRRRGWRPACANPGA